jgi:hypothetical protein
MKPKGSSGKFIIGLEVGSCMGTGSRRRYKHGYIQPAGKAKTTTAAIRNMKNVRLYWLDESKFDG